MLLLLTGASGVRKSTCRSAIEAALGDELDCVELRDLVAIPAAPDVAWRQRSVEAVVQRALAGDRDLLLAGDPVAPGLGRDALGAPGSRRLVVRRHRHERASSQRRRGGRARAVRAS